MTSYSFKDNLTIDNNKYLNWLDSSGLNRTSIIGLDVNNNVNLYSANGNVLINCETGSTSHTYINRNNQGNVFVASKLGIGIGTTSGMSGDVTIKKNGMITVDGNDGYLLVGGSTTTAGSSALQLYGNLHPTSRQQIDIVAGETSGNINLYTGARSLRFQIHNSGSAIFTPDGSTIRCSISDETSVFNNTLSIQVAGSPDATSNTHGGSLTVFGGLGVQKSLHVGGPVLMIPVGNTAARPAAPSRGSIRYNSQTDQFEGYGAGDTWGSLGGVIDIDQDTKILAEDGAGTNDNNLRFFTGGVERMRINSSGNIGVSTTAPSYKLDVAGSGRALSLVLSSTTQSAGIGTGGCLTALGGASFAKDVYVGGTVTSSSDIRLKENIEALATPSVNVLDSIDAIRTVKYNYINDPDTTKHIGFIAQDFEKLYPELLRRPPNGFYSLDYQKVTVILLECVKELKQQIADLRG